MEEKLTQTPLSLRKLSLSRLLLEGCIITHNTLHRYIYDLIIAESLHFQDMIIDSINDIKVAFYIAEPANDISTSQKDLYNLHRKLFKYKKIEPMKPMDLNQSPEAVLKQQKLLKEARDPRKVLNFVRRLPYKLQYDYQSNIFFKYFVQNFIIFYNFFKTTIVAVLLMFIYFLYTVFFFKIQFLKQLSVWFVIGMIYF